MKINWKFRGISGSQEIRESITSILAIIKSWVLCISLPKSKYYFILYHHPVAASVNDLYFLSANFNLLSYSHPKRDWFFDNQLIFFYFFFFTEITPLIRSTIFTLHDNNHRYFIWKKKYSHQDWLPPMIHIFHSFSFGNYFPGAFFFSLFLKLQWIIEMNWIV